ARPSTGSRQGRQGRERWRLRRPVGPAPPRGRGPWPASLTLSPEHRLLVEDVQVAREVLQRHLGVDLAPAHPKWRGEGRIALSTDGEGRGIAVVVDLADHVVVL